MSEQIEKIDITFKDLEAHDVRILANADKMHAFIFEWKERVISACKEGDHYATESLRKDFHDALDDFCITDLFNYRIYYLMG